METLLVERANGVVTVTLNRPDRLNAGNDTMWEELTTAIREVANNPDDRVFVLTGAGRAFCSGLDISADGGGPSEDRSFLHTMHKFGSLVLDLHRLSKPTIARVNGVAAGAGCNLALGCDLIVASDQARFSEIFSKRGMSIDGGGSWLLPRLIGLHKAKELAFLAEVLSAADAAALGLVNRVVPAGELDAAVADWAERLAAGPPLALSMTKALLNAGATSTMAQAVDAEAHAQAHNSLTADVAEALAAFTEKREPKFTGR